jgi:hypothetical protein
VLRVGTNEEYILSIKPISSGNHFFDHAVLTQPMHTVFMYLLPDGIHTEHVFDHALKVAAFI